MLVDAEHGLISDQHYYEVSLDIRNLFECVIGVSQANEIARQRCWLGKRKPHHSGSLRRGMDDQAGP